MSSEKGGVLRERDTEGRRVVIALGFGAVILGAPLLVLSGPGQQIAASPSAPRGPAPATVPSRPAALAGAALAQFRGNIVRAAPVGSAGGGGIAAHPVTSAPATTAPPTTTTTPPPTTVPRPTTTTAPKPTTTTIPPTTSTTTTTAPPPAANTAAGEATWYAESPAGGCASPTLPRGTVLKVTDDATGASITCLVDDVEGDNPGRVVDLAPSEFSQLADLSQGVIEVTISW